MDKEQKEKIKKFLKKTWWFIWESDSIWSWLLNIVLAFILIKFIVYPVLGLTLATSHPIVAVVSGSMEHDGSFDQWWSADANCPGNKDCIQSEFYYAFNISKEEFHDFRFQNGFNKGDIMILKGSDPENIEIGDVIVFRSKRPDPIIHRVINRWEEDGKYYYNTKGDHNMDIVRSVSLDETSIPEDKVIGKAVVRIPYIGWIKIAAVNIWTFARPR